MQVRMRISENGIKNLGEALARFQEEVRNPSNTATNPQFRSKYAPLDVVINTAKPILAKNGLSFIQSTGAEGENITVTTLLIHESGEWIESDPLVLPAYQIKGGGVKEFNAQGAGSSLTYARRYSLSAMLGLSSEDDDDANGQVFGDSKGTVGGAGTGKQGGSKQNDTPAPVEKPSAREKAIAEAKAKAAAKQEEASAEQSVPETKPEQAVEEGSTGGAVELVNASQLKAFGNMISLIAKRRGKDFVESEFIKELASKYGKNTLEELTFEEGKLLIPDLNAEMRK